MRFARRRRGKPSTIKAGHSLFHRHYNSSDPFVQASANSNYASQGRTEELLVHTEIDGPQGETQRGRLSDSRQRLTARSRTT